MLSRQIYQLVQNQLVRGRRDTVLAEERPVVGHDHEDHHRQQAGHQRYQNEVNLGIFNLVQVSDANADGRADPDLPRAGSG